MLNDKKLKSSKIVDYDTTLSKINSKSVDVHSLYGKHFKTVPSIKKPKEVTMLEEEKVSAYYTGGKLYASYDRLVSPV